MVLQLRGFFFLASAPVHRLVELLPTVVAGHLWGHAWARLRVQFLCDNMAVVGFSSLGSSCRPASSCHSSDPVITPRSASLISQCYALLAQGLAPSTHRVYAAGLRAYFQFCRSFSYPSFPTSEWLLMLFATWLAQSRRLAPPSVSAYIAAVRSWHIDLGSPIIIIIII